VTRVRIVGLEARSLRVPLVEPFVIASGRLDATDAVEVSIVVEHEGRRVVGLGECATLPPVTHETPAEIEAHVRALSARWQGLELADVEALCEHAFRQSSWASAAMGPVARAGLETAWLDVAGRLRERSLATLLAGDSRGATSKHETDITLPIAEPARMGELARGWVARGFRALKVKVGRALEEDVAGLRAVVEAAPDALLRLDANAALSSSEALRLLDAVRALGGVVEIFEQPCRADDLAGMADVVRGAGVPVVADESCQSLEDLLRLLDAGAATGINLKLVKNGGPLASFEIGHRAKLAGMKVMAGAMVETRLGLAAMLHVVTALGGVDYVDLDTALLLAEDPYEGGYEEALPMLTLAETPGHGVQRRARGA
jgi:L-alanine-DL-glutamate epimerase-like enolase superfamily enzyme